MSALDDFLDIHLSHCNIWHSNTGEGCNCGLSEAKQELEQLKEGIKEAVEFVEFAKTFTTFLHPTKKPMENWLERWGEYWTLVI